MILKENFNDLHKYRNLVFVVFIFFMMSTLSFLAMRGMQRSSAVSSRDFNPGNIINDATMSNANSMTKEEIQAFLTSKNSCNNRDYNQYVYLKGRYPHLDWHFEDDHFICLSEERFGDGVTIGEGQTAAEIIYEAAQEFKINPQVLLVLLEKEQSLITDDYPNSNQYRSATGYGCPDTAACNAKYYGFKNQIRNAAALFRDVLDHGYSRYPENRAGVYVQFSPNASCGSSEVYIENRATAALYRYTPYQPNTAALNAGYGQGDTCSAYGNRNFYLYFNDWFGSTQTGIEAELLNLPEGEYAFLTQETSTPTKALGLAPTNSIGTNVELTEHSLTSTREKWQLKKTTDGYYNLIHKDTKKALDLNLSNHNLTIWDQHDGCNQKWKLYTTNGTDVIFESACQANLVISVDGPTNINAQAYSHDNSQNWQIFVGPTISNGLYNIASSYSNQKVVDANGQNNGSNISIWESHHGSSQEWTATYDEKTDAYTFTNLISGKNLDLNGAVAKPNTNISLWQESGSCAQQWKLVQKENNYLFLSTCSLNYAIDLYGGLTANGTNIQLWTTHGDKSQQWRLNPITSPTVNRIYNIVAKTSRGTVFDIANGQNVAIWGKHNGENQRWKLIYNADTKDYTFVNPATNKALDINGGFTTPGTNVQVWYRNNGCGQRWKFNLNEEGYYEVISACHDQRVLDVYGGLSREGTNIQIWEQHGGDSQKFILAS